MEKKLKREQRKLSRRALLAKKKGINLFEAKNYQKQKQKVAKL
ncbi:TPA: transposase, partial [Enterococcus faecium]|nr:transposase [Enterococcus faecium]